MTSFFPYTPRQATYDELKASFVAREALLDELILSLKRQASAEALQHWMILGTRGMGKSHIITMIYLLVQQDETLNRKWTPILMKEEEQEIFSLHTLFIRIMTRLSDELYESDTQKSHEIGEVLDSLRNGKSQEEILETAVSYLKDFVVESQKRLLVLLENADDLFTRCLPNLNHIKKLRNILLNENFLLFLTTSPTSFERISRSSAPLYGFFRIRRLDLLDYDQSVELLNKWAGLEEKSDGRGDFISHLQKDNYRLRVLYHLTGGNPRVLLFLYMAISGQGGIKTAADTFRRLLENDLSAYYLSRMRELANQVQPIVIALAESDRNLTQTEIARKTFLPAKSIGTAMVRLENDGIVRPVTDKKGKNTLYTLTDHLFRLWYQWRTSIRDRMVVEAVVEFLAIWYKKKELDTWAGEGGLAGVYCQEAINFRRTEKYHNYLQEFRVYAETFIDQHLTKKDYHTLFDTMVFWKEYGLDTDKLMKTAIIEIEKHGGLDQAEDYFQEKLKHDEKDFDTYLQLGRILIQKEDFPGAEKVLEKAVELDPKDAAAWKDLGLTRGRQENYGGAEKAFAKAAKLDPKDDATWKVIGATRGLQENYGGAEKAFAKAAKLDPKDAATWKVLGATRFQQENHAGAEKAYAKAVKLDPKDAVAWKVLGATRGLQENYGGAEKAYAKAVKLDPKDAAAWKDLGATRGRQEDHAGAEKAYAKAVKLDPKDAVAWKGLGATRGLQEDHGGAEKAFAKAVKLDPKDAAAWKGLGATRGREKDHGGAEKAFAKAAKLDPKDAATWKVLGATRFQQENHAGAEKAYAKAVKLDPKDAVAWKVLGAARFRQENHAGAEKAFAKAVKLAPKDAEAWKNLGLARIPQENYAGVEKAFAKVVKLDPKDAEAWKVLGVARALQENYAGAEKAYAKAVKLDPKDAGAWKHLAFSRYKNYNFVQAAGNLVKSIKLNEKEIASYEFLCESCVMKNLPVETLALLENALSLDDATDEFRANIRFLRAMIHLHNMDKTPFLKDLESGVMLLEGLEEEKRRELLGKLMDFLVSIIIVDNIKEISAYIDGLKQVKIEQAEVFNPLQYVLDYYTEYFAEEKKKGTSVIRTQRVLDNIPGEIRGPVEEMVREAKKNVLWWESRPKLTSTNS